MYALTGQIQHERGLLMDKFIRIIKDIDNLISILGLVPQYSNALACLGTGPFLQLDLLINSLNEEFYNIKNNIEGKSPFNFNVD